MNPSRISVVVLLFVSGQLWGQTASTTPAIPAQTAAQPANTSPAGAEQIWKALWQPAFDPGKSASVKEVTLE